MISDTGTFIGRFQSDGAASMAVKGLTSRLVASPWKSHRGWSWSTGHKETNYLSIRHSIHPSHLSAFLRPLLSQAGTVRRWD